MSRCGVGCLAGVSCIAALSGSGLGQVTVTGEYTKVVQVSVQIDVRDPTSPPDNPAFFFNSDVTDARLRADTEVTLSELPTVGDTGVEVLSFRLTRLAIVFEDNLEIPLGDFGQPPIFTILSDDLGIEFRDDGTGELEVTAAVPDAFVDYGEIGARAIGGVTIEVQGFEDPIEFDARDFGSFVSNLPGLTYSLDVANGAVVQKLNLPDDFDFFGANVIGEDFGIVFFPTVFGDTFELVSPLIEACDEGASPLGTFGGAIKVFEVPLTTGPRGIGVADADGDGTPDVISAFSLVSSNGITSLLNLGGGAFDDFDLPFAPTDPSPNAIATGDFNEDGAVDAAATSSTGDSVNIVFGNGDGSFAFAQTVVVGDSPEELDAKDVNGDGAIDIVAVSRFSDEMHVLLNDGSGVFSISQVVPIGDSPREIQLDDLDGDGDIDAAVVNSTDDDVVIALNDGSGVFSVTGSFEVGNQPFSLKAGDIDNDGDIDVVTCAFSERTVSVLFNNGDATFSGPAQVAPGPQPREVALSDVDNDGDLDVVVSTGDGVGVLKNDGSGVLSEFALTGDIGVAFDLAIADFDGDGDQDIAATRFVSGPGVDGWTILFNGCIGISGGSGCNAADLVEPFGITDLDDVDAFIPLFLAGDPAVDFVPPANVVDLDDLDAFILAFLAGCP